MFKEDIGLLCCPETGESLAFKSITRVDGDGEVLEGTLVSERSGKDYPIANGIPRFILHDAGYNPTWNYKWTVIDRGRGLNYRILDKDDPAYRIHDIFDRNDHEGLSYRHARGGVVLDIGCGVGQYSYRILKEYTPRKLVSLDLTGAIDIFRKVMLERFPEEKPRMLLVQASVFQMPFRRETFDYVLSLGVLHHTGDTRRAVASAASVLKPGGEINFWVYGPFSVHVDNAETGRGKLMTLGRFLPYYLLYAWMMLQVRLFRSLPHWLNVRILEVFSSELWYQLCRIPLLKYGFRFIFTTVMHPDRDYRLINNYDGWCNTWAETWSEQELLATLREGDIVILGISPHQTGIWGRKLPGFYPCAALPAS
jgi:SAM-dependent methyltransferase